jgi:hypothetical protein
MNQPTHHEKWQPKQNKPLGWLLTSFGLFTFITSVIPMMIADEGSPDENSLMMLGLFMFFGGAVLVIYGKRHLTRNAEEVLAKDKRPPVLYLRSFGGEADTFGVRAFFRAVGIQFTNRSMGLTISPWDPTFQAQLAIVMERIGPYIAVGRPGAKLPGTGAARLYIADSQWQQRVTDLLHQARLVIVRAGTSEGLQWEIDTVMNNIKPQQLLVILPISRKDYQIFRELIHQHGINFPEKIPKAMLVTFEKNWQPVFLKGDGKLEDTLIPYFTANGITPPKPGMLDAFRMFFQ